MKLNSKELRNLNEKKDSPHKKNELYLILDNVLDTYNIGSVFRLSDAAGVKELLLCDKTDTPPNHRIKKSSINTTEVVDWKYYPSTVQAIEDLRKRVSGIQIIAVELTKDSVPFNEFEYKFPVALIVGNESYGVSEEVTKLCDATVELPMYGVNISLNVMVSLAIATYHVLLNAKD